MWLDEYSQSHKNKMNKLIHNICVPLIMFSILGFFHIIPTPQFLNFSFFTIYWSYLFVTMCLVFYAMLSSVTAIKMLILTTVMLIPIHLIAQHQELYALPIFSAIFILSWLGQFIGHKIEGKKPSFFQDLQFLLIGPLWVFKF
ncbi:MAG: DUF962 domain-containing protein [Bdellovibrio sp.]